MIADLAKLGLTPEQLAARRRGLGGSDAAVLMSGNPEKVVKLWEEKCGLREADDLSDVLPVMIGSWTEPFNAAWYMKVTGRQVIRRNESLIHPEIPWWRSNIDGVSIREDDLHELWEAKHVGGREDLKSIVVPRYTAQVYHNMHAAGLKRGVLSIIESTSDLRIFEFVQDSAYTQMLYEREAAFWECVTTKCPPPEWMDIAPPPPVTDFRAVSMQGNQEWAEAATIWLETKALAKTFEATAKFLKGMVEADVGEAKGHGIIVTRSKSNALTIKADEAKQPRGSRRRK